MLEEGGFDLALEAMKGAKYCDVRLLEEEVVELGLRPRSEDLYESRSERIVCRSVDNGYGVATSTVPIPEGITKVARQALAASRHGQGIDLAPVPPQSGSRSHKELKPFDVENVRKFLKNLRDALSNIVKGADVRPEFVCSYSRSDSILATSEGTNVRETIPKTDLTIYVAVKKAFQGFSGKVLGGIGGLEVLENQPWNDILHDLAGRALDGADSKPLPAFYRGSRFKVILDNEGSGALAHEVAHLLEADVFQEGVFHGLEPAEDFAIVDDPCIPGSYGSFLWDDEGVKSGNKVLVSREGIDLLHTRLTAKGEKGVPGNARGVFREPRPGPSNVFIRPSDWDVAEIFEETGRGLYARGLIRAECDTAVGKIEIMPEIAYMIEKKEVKRKIKGLRVTGFVKELIQKVDAIAKDFALRPSFEKDFAISEGGPHIRMDGVICL
ncbi:MAG: TldD/PmbA family protein [Candidatus Brockarchaeota archaeon]|nr:TldD/PmbA family protein [Candidatus Brockarchaeota archaeon]